MDNKKIIKVNQYHRRVVSFLLGKDARNREEIIQYWSDKLSLASTNKVLYYDAVKDLIEVEIIEENEEKGLKIHTQYTLLKDPFIKMALEKNEEICDFMFSNEKYTFIEWFQRFLPIAMKLNKQGIAPKIAKNMFKYK